MKALYWLEGSELAPAAIDSSLFTHAFYAFVGFDRRTNKVVEPTTQNFRTFTATVQARNPFLKTLISLGGDNVKGEDFAVMVSNVSNRSIFIESAIELAMTYGFHGLDLVWEYPSTLTDMKNLGVFLDEWRAAAVAEASISGKDPLLLTAKVFYSSELSNGLIKYPVESVAMNLDWINVMSYDLYTPSSFKDQTGTPAPLRNSKDKGAPSVEVGVKAWMEGGMPAKKIALGLPFHGFAWKLLYPSNHGLFAPADGADTSVSPNGYVAYSGIQTLVRQNRANFVDDTEYVLRYCYYGTTWIGYEDRQSITAKVKYAKGKGLLGYFGWQAADDDNWHLSKAASDAWGA